MDPKVTLARLRELISDYYNADDEHRRSIGADIVAYCEQLDRWMSKGGFSPWAK